MSTKVICTVGWFADNAHSKFAVFLYISVIDRIEYEVTIQISALQHGLCVLGCVRACAVEIKPEMLRAACFIDVHVRVWTRIRFALQEKKGLFNTIYSQIVLTGS